MFKYLKEHFDINFVIWTSIFIGVTIFSFKINGVTSPYLSIIRVNEAILKKIKYNMRVIQTFRDKPKLCIVHHLDSQDLIKSNVLKEFLREEGNIIAELVESSIEKQTKMTKIATPTEVAKLIAYSYI